MVSKFCKIRRDNIIFENINKTKTNSLVTLSKSTISRTEDSNSNNYIFCKKCNNLLGFEYIKNDEEENKNYTYNYTTPNESNFYLLKKNIKERKNKSINVNFISFKESLLKNIKKEFTNIINNIQNINIEINLHNFV